MPTSSGNKLSIYSKQKVLNFKFKNTLIKGVDPKKFGITHCRDFLSHGIEIPWSASDSLLYRVQLNKQTLEIQSIFETSSLQFFGNRPSTLMYHQCNLDIGI